MEFSPLAGARVRAARAGRYASAGPRPGLRAARPAGALGLGLAVAVTPIGPALAQTPSETTPSERLPPPDGPATHLVVVTGIGGEPAYVDAFHELGARLRGAALERWGLPASHVVWLAEEPGRAPGRVAGRSTVERLAAELEALAGRAAPSDRVLIVLIGHGSARGEESALNLPGPDLTGSHLAELVGVLGSREVAVVNAASASGGFVLPLAGPHRIVVTATASPRERERTRFGRHFVDALAGEGADADRDGRVSLLEAFEYARREVARTYETDNQIQTEHALLEDDADGKGSLEPVPGGDGALARRFFLVRPSGAAAVAGGVDPSDPAAAALLAEKRRLEEEIEALKAQKTGLPAEEYERRLEALLLDLARTTRELREHSGGGP